MKNEFVTLKVVEMKVRRGTREGYLEVLLKVEGKEEKKFVMKKVDRFWSEQGSVDELV